MRVLVTGATGFVGSNAAAALRRSGHELRLLVRDRARVPPVLAGVETADGDVVEADTVRTALEGCDGVLHAASVYSFDARDRARIEAVNVRGTDVVLRESHARGLDPIVYVSSTLALDPSGGLRTAATEPGTFSEPYSRSKADAERIARRLQDEGAPVTVVYPSWVMGPDSPTFGVPQATIADLLRRRMPVLPPGSIEIVDVRDVATAIARAMQPGRRPRRYLLAGEEVTLADLVERLERLTRRPLPHMTAPRRAMRAIGGVIDAVQRVSPVRLPGSRGGIVAISHGARSDTESARRDLGFAPRDLDETLADTVRSLLAKGHIGARHAGALAAPAAAGRPPRRRPTHSPGN